MRTAVASLLALLGALVVTTPVAADEARPSADEVKRVMGYFATGKGKGPVLLELVPCLKVDRKEGEARKSCVEPVTDGVPAKTIVSAYMQFFVPADDTYEVTVEFAKDGAVKSTKTVSIQTGYAYGTWTAASLNDAGTWTIKARVGADEVGSATVQVR
jgi:hypothetical protein